MSDDYLVRHCAPTLAGIKTGSLFTCPFSCQKELLDSVRRLNKRLLSKGLRVLPLRWSQNKALIYVYRPKKLSSDISNAAAEQILQRHGYDTATCEWMRTWEDTCRDIGANLVCESVICMEAPDDEAEAGCRSLGAALA